MLRSFIKYKLFSIGLLTSVSHGPSAIAAFLLNLNFLIASKVRKANMCYRTKFCQNQPKGVVLSVFDTMLKKMYYVADKTFSERLFQCQNRSRQVTTRSREISQRGRITTVLYNTLSVTV